MELVVTCIWSVAVAILIYRAIGQRQIFADLRPVPGSAPPSARVLVIVPARNESVNIATCIEALSRQTYPEPQFAVRVVDDHSCDGTGEIARKAANSQKGFQVLESPPLPPRWVGKCHACWTGATRDIGARPEWMCFIDADVVAAPSLLVAAVAQAQAQSLDLLSLAPKQILRTWTERLVMPCGLYCLAFCRNMKRLQAQECADATVTGQFLLVRAKTYFAVGGHKTVFNEICEDVALARLIKQRGGRVALFGGQELLSCRMYHNWAALRAGLAKNLVDMLGGAARTVWTAIAAVSLAWATIGVPLFDASGCAHDAPQACAALGLSLASSGAAFGLHLAGARFFAIPLWYGLLFPFGYSLGALIAADSLRWRFRKRIAWKGRIYQ